MPRPIVRGAELKHSYRLSNHLCHPTRACTLPFFFARPIIFGLSAFYGWSVAENMM